MVEGQSPRKVVGRRENIIAWDKQYRPMNRFDLGLHTKTELAKISPQHSHRS